MNPLLDFSGLPRYASLKPEHVTPAIDTLLAENRALVERLVADPVPPTWNGFADPMEEAHDRLGRAWGAVGNLHAVDDNPAIREAYNANQPKLTQYYTELAQNLRLYEKYKALGAQAGFEQLSPAQRRIIENELRDFRLGGAELPPGEKARFGEIQEELAQLATRFSENVLDATNAFGLYVTAEEELSGIPPDVMEAARLAAKGEGRDGWKLTLHAPSYVPAIQYARSRALRETLYRAHVTRASEEFGRSLMLAREYEQQHLAQGASAPAPQTVPPEKTASDWDNTPLITRLLKLRNEAARLLGYASFAELSLVPKMAEKPQEVLDFLNGLAEKALPFARRDYEELKEFARNELGLADLCACDLAYASEMLRAKRYEFSDQELKAYFPEPKVLEGMFRVVREIFGIRIEMDNAESWHPDVRFLRVIDNDGEVIGRFYLDLYARDTKRGGAWMDEAMTRRRRGGMLQTPVALLICNFSGPVGEKDGKPRPALFTHDEVLTLFHEFGHGLHHLLTRVDYAGASGIRGVEWDAIELPSQFMENFCWEWEVLRHMTAHVDSGEPLPRVLFDKMVAARNFQSGMQMARQLEYSLFDMHLHHDLDLEGAGSGATTPLELLKQVRSRVAVAFPPAYNRFPNNFGHIFAGGYSAGYYSYKWAEVLSADAYSMFEGNAGSSQSVLDPEIGARFRDEILAVGGSRPAMESFRAFRGREPRIDALLRHSGMIPA
ncbi:MAG: M3 family peptidase [Betaproteobacteria bacterium]|nr:M3 family peptidase [Betaproteobacteria bacterium]